MQTFTKRGFVRLAAFMTAAVAVLVGSTVASHRESQRYRAALEITYLRALQDSADLMGNLSSALAKQADAPRGAQSVKLAAQLWRDASAAKAALAALPLPEGERTAANKFLSQVGDYSMALERSGGTLTARQRETLVDLRGYAGALERELGAMLERAADGEPWALPAQDAPQTGAADDGRTALERSFSGYPTLIYDGPFSDHMLERDPALTQGLPEIPAQDAQALAAYAAMTDPSLMTRGADEQSRLPSYTFTLGTNISAAVTKAGGLVVYVADGRPVGEPSIGEQDAREAAVTYLGYLGLSNLEETYASTDGGVMTICYAYRDGDVICYTDLVKVGVALDTGEVVLFDARGYIMSHHARELPAAAVPAERAREAVSSYLDVKSSRLALIPTAGGGEALCHEFYGVDGEGGELLSYVNAVTGEVEELLQLVRTEHGTLAM